MCDLLLPAHVPKLPLRCSALALALGLSALTGLLHAQTNVAIVLTNEAMKNQAMLERFGATKVPAHDPSTILKCGRDYWFFCTGMGISSRHSKDLAEWFVGPRVFGERLPAWHTNSVPGNRGHLWAPDVIHFRGRYLVYYSVSTFGRNTSAIGLVSNATLDPASPDFRWVEEGLVLESRATNDFNAIDPAVFADHDGRLWLSFGSFWSGLKLIELDPNTGKRLAADSPIYPLANYRAIEAPFIHRQEGRYYLFMNWDTCCRGLSSTYNIRVGRSDSVFGPYVDRAGKQLMDGGGTLLIATKGPFIGPGHAGIVRSNDTDLLSCHFYDGTTPRGTAKLALVPLRWSQGWPEVAVAE